MKTRILIVMLSLAAVILAGCNAPTNITEPSAPATATKTSTPIDASEPITPAAATESSTNFDLTGIWTGVLTQDLSSGKCPPMPAQQGVVVIEQIGNSFNMYFGEGFVCAPAEACEFHGTIEGDTYSATNAGYADDEGVYYTSLILVPMAPNSVIGSGISEYIHPDMECEWMTSLTLIRQDAGNGE